MVTGLSARKVWEHLLVGGDIVEFVAPLPDEFHGWAKQVAADILAAVDAREASLDKTYRQITAGMPDGWDPASRDGRRTFATDACTHPDRWAMFAMLDGRDIRPELLRRTDPGPNVTPTGRTRSEDTA